MEENTDQRRVGWAGAAAWVITVWALLGGAVLLLVVTINVLSVIGGVVWKPFPGDFELTQIGVAIAVFAFLPYCQLSGANVTADIFTQNASRRFLSRIRTIAALVALAFALLLLWRMYEGMLNQREYGYVTAIVQFPVWLAYVPILVSLGLLALAALVSFTDERLSLSGKP